MAAWFRDWACACNVFRVISFPSHVSKFSSCPHKVFGARNQEAASEVVAGSVVAIDDQWAQLAALRFELGEGRVFLDLTKNEHEGDDQEVLDARGKMTQMVSREEEVDKINPIWELGEEDNTPVIGYTAGSKPGSEIVVLGRHLRRMAEDRWLNDECVNCFMWLLQQRESAFEDRPPVSFMSTHFSNKVLFCASCLQLLRGTFSPNVLVVYSDECIYIQVASSTPEEVQRWLRRLVRGGSPFGVSQMYLPLCVDNYHWVMIRINITRRRIELYDSMGAGKRPQETTLGFLEKLKALMVFEERKLKDRGELPEGMPEVRTWEVASKTEEGTPQQTNHVDCGVFTCMFAYYLSSGIGLSFEQKDIRSIRKRMTLMILNKSIL